MRTVLSQQSKGVFHQLSQVAGGAGVKTVIENHDAWLHNADVQAQITTAIRLQTLNADRPAETAGRIESQRRQLATLVTKLPIRLSHAG